MPKRFRTTSPATGAPLVFDWEGNEPPTRQDLLRIENEQLENEVAQIKPKERPGYFDQVKQNVKGLLNYRPDVAIPEMMSGIDQMISGQGGEQYPRIAGLNKAARGLFGTIGTPAALAGMAVAPIPTLGALAAISAGGPLVGGGVESVIPNAPEETKELITTGGTAALGGLAGALLRPKAAPTPRPQPRFSTPPTGPAQLPPGGMGRLGAPARQLGAGPAQRPPSVQFPPRGLPPGRGPVVPPEPPAVPPRGVAPGMGGLLPEATGEPVQSPVRIPPAAEPPAITDPYVAWRNQNFVRQPNGLWEDPSSFVLYTDEALHGMYEGTQLPVMSSRIGGRTIDVTPESAITVPEPPPGIPPRPKAPLGAILAQENVVRPSPEPSPNLAPAGPEWWENQPETDVERQMGFESLWPPRKPRAARRAPTAPPAPVEAPLRQVQPQVEPVKAAVEPPKPAQPPAPAPKPPAPTVKEEAPPKYDEEVVEPGDPESRIVRYPTEGKPDKFDAEFDVPGIEEGDVVHGKAGTYEVTQVTDTHVSYRFTNNSGKVSEASMPTENFDKLAQSGELEKRSAPEQKLPTPAPVEIPKRETNGVVRIQGDIPPIPPEKSVFPPKVSPEEALKAKETYKGPNLDKIRAEEESKVVEIPKKVEPPKPVEGLDLSGLEEYNNIPVQAPKPTKPVAAPKPVEHPKTVAAPKPPAEPPAPKPTVQIGDAVKNAVLEFVKVRRLGNVGQIQEKTGLTGEQVEAALADLVKRNIIEQQGQKWAYKPAVDLKTGKTEALPQVEGAPKPGPVQPPVKPKPGEVKPPEAAKPPEAKPEVPKNAEGKPIITAPAEKVAESAYRLAQERKNAQQIKDQIASYEKRGMDDLAKKKRLYYKKYLKSIGKTDEELFAQSKEPPKTEPLKVEPPKKAEPPKKEPVQRKESYSDAEKEEMMSEMDMLEEAEGQRDLTPAEKKRWKDLNIMLGFWDDTRGSSRLIPALKDIASSLQKRMARKGPEKGTIRKDLATSGERVLEAEGSAADQLRERIFHSRTRGGVHSGKWSADYLKATRFLDKTEFDQMVDILQGQARRGTRKVVEAAREVRRILDDVHNMARVAGVEETLPNGQKITTRYRTDYWPMKFQPDFWTVSGKTRKTMAQRLVDRGEASNLVEAEKFIREIIEPQTENIMGHLQRPRHVNIQEFSRRDPAVLLEYFEDAGRKIAEVQEFGNKGSKVSYPKGVAEALEKIRREGGDYETSTKIVDAYFGRSPLRHVESVIWQKISSLQVVSKLGLAVISNVTQPMYTALVTGNMTLAKAIIQTIRHPEQAKMAATEAGSILPGIIHQIQNEVGISSASLGSKVLQGTKFMAVEMKNRTVATLAGMYHAVKMFDKLKANPKNAYAARQLHKWLGLDPEVLLKQGKLTRDDLLVAGKTLADRTQFRSSAMDLPWTWGQSLPMKMITLFKNFAFNQGKLMKQAVVREVARGNFRPLIPLLTTIPILGTLIDRFKRFLFNREQPEGFWDTVIGAYTSTGPLGIMADTLARAAYGKAAESISGPIVSDTAGALEAGVKGPKDLAKWAVKQPTITKPITNRIWPPKKKAAGNVGPPLPALP